MIVGRFFGKTGRGLAVAAAILAAIGLTTVPRPAGAGGWGGGGISPGAAVGIGLGAFALGAVLSQPYYNPYYYPYGYYGYYYPPAAYYPPAGLYPRRPSCFYGAAVGCQSSEPVSSSSPREGGVQVREFVAL